jgi:hypothetical protein
MGLKHQLETSRKNVWQEAGYNEFGDDVISTASGFCF